MLLGDCCDAVKAFSVNMATKTIGNCAKGASVDVVLGCSATQNGRPNLTRLSARRTPHGGIPKLSLQLASHVTVHNKDRAVCPLVRQDRPGGEGAPSTLGDEGKREKLQNDDSGKGAELEQKRNEGLGKKAVWGLDTDAKPADHTVSPAEPIPAKHRSDPFLVKPYDKSRQACGPVSTAHMDPRANGWHDPAGKRFCSSNARNEAIDTRAEDPPTPSAKNHARMSSLAGTLDEEPEAKCDVSQGNNIPATAFLHSLWAWFYQLNLSSSALDTGMVFPGPATSSMEVI